MRIGFVGLGKLGYPVAAGMASKGHVVTGFDIRAEVTNHEPRPYKETGPDGKQDFNEWFKENQKARSNLKFDYLYEIVLESDIIFVAVQTPHEPNLEGTTFIKDQEYQDFDYSYLKGVCQNISNIIENNGIQRKIPVVIISTALSWTMDTEILPICHENMELIYNPYFIAMGTTLYDFFHPEFVLIGTSCKSTDNLFQRLVNFYGTITAKCEVFYTSRLNAELIKMAYNTFIGMKISFANTLMEICDKLPGADVDAVTDALKLATDRLISPKYLSGGMGDGGGCHPRDQVALAYLGEKLQLSYNPFVDLIRAREHQTAYLGNIAIRYAVKSNLPICVLGLAFKPEINLTVGSPALLLVNYLKNHYPELLIKAFDPYLNKGTEFPKGPHVIVIGCKHEVFKKYDFPAKSIIIDPWRYIPKSPMYRVVYIGRNAK